MIAWLKKYRETRRALAAVQVRRKLMNLDGLATAYEISVLTGLSLGRVYQALTDLKSNGLVADIWRADDNQPHLPARRFYRGVKDR